MKKELVISDKMAKPVGPYSPGIKAGNFVFTAGQLGVDPATGKLHEGIEAQTKQCLLHVFGEWRFKRGFKRKVLVRHRHVLTAAGQRLVG